MSTFPEAEAYWGLDLGHHQIEGVVVRLGQEPAIVARVQVATETHLGYEHMLGQLRQALQQLEQVAGYRPDRLGVSTPGTLVARTGLLKNSNVPGLDGRPLAIDFARELGLPVVVGNDANCLTLAETRLGIIAEQFPDAQVVFGILMDQGVGGGLSINGRVVQGPNGTTGEWGHIYLEPSENNLCFCGKRGCIESILAVPALERFYASKAGTARPLTEIIALAETSGDYAAQTTLQRLTNFFGHAISVLVNILDPDVIVVGGQASGIRQLYEESSRVVATYVIDQRFETPIVRAHFGASASAVGAALLVA